jgi:hypothetical protein
MNPTSTKIVNSVAIASGIFAAHLATAQAAGVSMADYCTRNQCVYNSLGSGAQNIVGEPQAQGVLFRQVLTGSFPGWYQMGFSASGISPDAVLFYPQPGCPAGKPAYLDSAGVDPWLPKFSEYDGATLWTDIEPAVTVTWQSIYYANPTDHGCQPSTFWCAPPGCTGTLAPASEVEALNYKPPFHLQ